MENFRQLLQRLIHEKMTIEPPASATRVRPNVYDLYAMFHICAATAITYSFPAGIFIQNLVVFDIFSIVPTVRK